jgi:hypothetical protein
MRAEVFVRGRRLVAIDTNVIRLPVEKSVSSTPDPLQEARALVAAYEALSHRDRNYRSKTYADLLHRALADLVSSCTPLRAEVADQFVQMLRRAEYGDGPAAAISAQDRQRRLKLVTKP